MDDAADPQRLRAVYCWINEFFGPEAGITAVNGYTELWKEHIGSLATLCNSKVFNKKTAEAPLQAFKDAKDILQTVSDKVLFNQRYKELDPEAAASGNETAIYKFIVLMLSVVSIFLEECLTEAHSVLQAKGLEAVMAGILSQVNNSGEQWWQGSSDIASPAPFTAVENNESFGKYEVMPTTPRSVLRRKALAPVSPIHSAVNSPATIKARQEELRRMRNRVNELEDTCDQQNRQLDQARQQESQLKLSLAEMKGRWATAEEASKRHQASYDEVAAELEKEKAIRADLARKANATLADKNKYKAEVERNDALKAALVDQLSSSQAVRADVEKKLRDLQHENCEMEERYTALEKAMYEVKAQLDQKSVSEAEAVKAATEKAAQHRRDLAQKEEEFQCAITAETDLRLRLQATHLQLEQKTMELEEEVGRLKQKIQELEEAKVLMTDEAMKTEQKYAERMEALRSEEAASKDIDKKNIALLGEKLSRLQVQLEETEERLKEQTACALSNGEKYIATLADAEGLNKTVALLQENLKNALADEEKVQQLRSLEEELQSIRSTLASREADLQKQTEESEKNAVEHTTTVKTMEATELELRAEILVQTELLETTKSEAGARLEALEEELAACQRELKNTQKLNQNLETERDVLLEKEARLGVVERELRNVTAERDDLRQKEAHLTNVEKDLLAKIDRIKYLEKDLGEVKDERYGLSEKLAQLQVSQRVLAGEASMLKAMEEDRDKMLEKLQQQQNRHAKELQEANSTNHQLTLKIEELVRETDKKDRIHADLDGRLKQLEDFARQLVADMNNLRNENDALKQERVLLEQQMAEAAEQQMQEEVEEDPIMEESIGQQDLTLVGNASLDRSHADSTIGDLGHLDMMDDEDDEVLFHLKSIDGSSYEQSYRLPSASTSQGPNFDVDKERVEELKRRNQMLHPSQRCSYATEFSNYASPSASERQMQSGFKTPQANRVQEAPETPVAEKENIPAETASVKSSTKSHRFTRRISNVFLKPKNK